MKSIRQFLAPLTASSLAVALCGSALSGEPLQPLPSAKDLPGKLRFHGRYRHRSRSNDIAQPSELWVNRTPDGGIVALALVDYTIRVELMGQEKVQVPAGTFEANDVVLTQTSSAHTWFKKRAGQTADFRVLENGIIVRILRRRESYELELLDYDIPHRLPGHSYASQLSLQLTGPFLTGI